MNIFIQYAPVLVIVMMFLIQQRVIVTPEQLEKIDNRLKKMNESENVKSQLPEDFYKKWQDRLNRLPC